MGRLLPSTAFYCLPLKTGASMIATLTLIGALAGFGGAMAFLNEYNTSSQKTMQVYTYIGRNQNELSSDERKILSRRILVVGTVFWLSLMTLISSALVIYGSMKSHARLLLPWLVTFVFWAMLGVYAIDATADNFLTIYKNIMGGILLYSCQLMVFGVSWYVWLCILALFFEINSSKLVNHPKNMTDHQLEPKTVYRGSSNGSDEWNVYS